jgi:glycosyltransferase involved in cell wall biosynthesis
VKVALLSRAAHPLHDPGGMERAVYLLAKHLQARGVETVLVTRPATRAGTFPGRVVTVPYADSGRGHGRVLSRTVHYPAFARRVGETVAAMVRAAEVDVVDAQGLTALGYGRRRRRDSGLRAPLIMNPQGLEEHKAGGLKRLALARLRALSREAARLSDRVVATDEATRAEVPRYLGIDPSRVVVLPNGVDLDEIAAATPSDARGAAEAALPALRGADPVFLSVGRLERYKGLDDARDALETLHAEGRLGRRWAWVVAGDGPAAGRLRRALSPALEGHVHLAGRVDEGLLHALYERADVFVHPTHYEGSSLVTLEAMAHGRAVVATRVGGIPDKVTDGLTGLLVAPADRAALAAALGELAMNRARRETMGAAGRCRVRADFAWSVLVDRTLALYESLLGEARR